MGIHRRFEAIPPGGGDPIPFPPKKGVITENCRAASDIDIEVEETPKDREKDQFGGVVYDPVSGTWLKPGSKVVSYTWDDYSGDPIQKDITPEEIQKISTPPFHKPGDVSRDPGIDLSTVSGALKPNGLEKREEYEVKEVDRKVDGPILKARVRGQNKKEKALEKKINRKFQEEEGVQPSISDIVQSITENLEFQETYIESIDVKIPVIEFNEMFGYEALDVCAKIAGANWTVLQDALHFFMPDSRMHPTVCTTDPNGISQFGENTRLLESDAKPNPIRKGTVKDSEDSSQIKNRIQVMNAGELSETPRIETQAGDGVKDEFHLTYEPECGTIDADVKCFHGNGHPTGVAWVRQDWGDREAVQQVLDEGIPYESPLCGGAPSSYYGLYINTKEKAVRVVVAITGESAIIPQDDVLEISYRHRDPVYMVIDDPQSIAKWGVREQILVVPDRHLIEEVKMIAEAEIRDYAQPLKGIECEVYNDIYRVGDYVDFVIPELGIDDRFCIYEIIRSFDVSKRNTFPQQDPGQSVKIKAGKKIPLRLDDILTALERKRRALERFHNLTDLSASTGFTVPLEKEEVMKEEVSIKDNFCIVPMNCARIGVSRIGVGRICND